MLAKLTMKLRTKDENTKVSTNMASAFHGALMEHIEKECVVELHDQPVNPYSQYIMVEDEVCIWNVCTISSKAYEKINALHL